MQSRNQGWIEQSFQILAGVASHGISNGIQASDWATPHTGLPGKFPEHTYFQARPGGPQPSPCLAPCPTYLPCYKRPGGTKRAGKWGGKNPIKLTDGFPSSWRLELVFDEGALSFSWLSQASPVASPNDDPRCFFLPPSVPCKCWGQIHGRTFSPSNT